MELPFLLHECVYIQYVRPAYGPALQGNGRSQMKLACPGCCSRPGGLPSSPCNIRRQSSGGLGLRATRAHTQPSSCPKRKASPEPLRKASYQQSCQSHLNDNAHQQTPNATPSAGGLQRCTRCVVNSVASTRLSDKSRKEIVQSIQ